MALRCAHVPTAPSRPRTTATRCDYTLPVEVRVKDKVSRMTMAEKIANLDTQAPAIASLG